MVLKNGRSTDKYVFLVFIGNGINTVLIEWQLDQDFTRFALFALLPLLFCVSLVGFTVPLSAFLCLTPMPPFLAIEQVQYIVEMVGFGPTNYTPAMMIPPTSYTFWRVDPSFRMMAFKRELQRYLGTTLGCFLSPLRCLRWS